MTLPSGIYTSPAQYMAELVASAPTFQAGRGVATELDAMAGVNIIYALEDDEHPSDRPNAMVYEVDDIESVRGGYSSGSVVVNFESNVPESLRKSEQSEDGPDPREAIIQFSNYVGAIILEILNNAEQGGRLMVRRARRLGRIRRSLVQDAEDYLSQAVRFYYGAAGGEG